MQIVSRTLRRTQIVPLVLENTLRSNKLTLCTIQSDNAYIVISESPDVEMFPLLIVVHLVELDVLLFACLVVSNTGVLHMVSELGSRPVTHLRVFGETVRHCTARAGSTEFLEVGVGDTKNKAMLLAELENLTDMLFLDVTVQSHVRTTFSRGQRIVVSHQVLSTDELCQPVIAGMHTLRATAVDSEELCGDSTDTSRKSLFEKFIKASVRDADDEGAQTKDSPVAHIREHTKNLKASAGRRHTHFHILCQFIISGDNGTLESEVVLVAELIHKFLVLLVENGITLERQKSRIGFDTEEVQKVVGYAVGTFKVTERVSKTAPMEQEAFVEEILVERHPVLINRPVLGKCTQHKLFELLYVHGIERRGFVNHTRIPRLLKVSEAILTSERTTTETVEGHGHRAVRELSTETGRTVSILRYLETFVLSDVLRSFR